MYNKKNYLMLYSPLKLFPQGIWQNLNSFLSYKMHNKRSNFVSTCLTTDEKLTHSAIESQPTIVKTNPFKIIDKLFTL